MSLARRLALGVSEAHLLGAHLLDAQRLGAQWLEPS